MPYEENQNDVSDNSMVAGNSKLKKDLLHLQLKNQELENFKVVLEE